MKKLLAFLCVVSVACGSVIRTDRILVDPDCGDRLQQIVETPTRFGLVPPSGSETKVGYESVPESDKKNILELFTTERTTEPPRTTKAPRTTEAPKTVEFTEPKREGEDDGSYKPERDNALVGRYDDGSYKPETPLFIYSQPSADPCVLCEQQKLLVQTPVRLPEEPTRFEYETHVVPTPAPVVLQPQTFVEERREEPCEEPKITVFPEPVRTTVVRTDAPQFVVNVPEETIVPPVQNVVRTEPQFVPTTTTFVEQPVPLPVVQSVQRVETPVRVPELPTLLEEPCDDTKVVLNQPTHFLKTEEVVRPAVQNILRTPETTQFVVPTVQRFDTPTYTPVVQNVVRTEQYRVELPRQEYVLRAPTFVTSPVVQTVVRREPTLVQEPCLDETVFLKK